jgi:alpha-galactosidase
VEEIDAVPVNRATGLVYAEGWQSWSGTGLFGVAESPPAVAGADGAAINCQYRRAAPAGVFEGSGLLAVDPGNGAAPVVFAAAGVTNRVPVIRAVLRGEDLVVSADTPVTQLPDGRPGGLLGALGRWAERFGPGPGALRPVPPVWCSWYQYFERVTAADVAANLDLMALLDLPVAVVQIDDGYQACPGDWLSPRPGFGDLPGLVSRIRDTGRRAGIWIAPWLVGRSSAVFRDHPEWVLREPSSAEPVSAGHVVRDDCYALDLSHPGAAAYLTEVLTTMRGWGIDYFKIDFCYAGAYEGLRGADSPDISGVRAYRDGLRLIRSAIGPDALLVGCGAPTLASVGLVDAMRVGPDIAASYEPAAGSPAEPSQRNATRNVLARAWQHGRLWINDPDCLMLRPEVERREDWASAVARYGGVRASGDGLDQLDSWGLETTRALLVTSPVAPFTPA